MLFTFGRQLIIFLMTAFSMSFFIIFMIEAANKVGRASKCVTNPGSCYCFTSLLSFFWLLVALFFLSFPFDHI